MREEKNLQGKERLNVASKSGCTKKPLGIKEKKIQPMRLFIAPHSEQQDAVIIVLGEGLVWWLPWDWPWLTESKKMSTEEYRTGLGKE